MAHPCILLASLLSYLARNPRGMTETDVINLRSLWLVQSLRGLFLNICCLHKKGFLMNSSPPRRKQNSLTGSIPPSLNRTLERVSETGKLVWIYSNSKGKPVKVDHETSARVATEDSNVRGQLVPKKKLRKSDRHASTGCKISVEIRDDTT